MSWITVIWSAGSGVCLMLALMYFFVWSRVRRAWANLCFSVVMLSVLGLAIAEMVMMRTGTPELRMRAVTVGTTTIKYLKK